MLTLQLNQYKMEGIDSSRFLRYGGAKKPTNEMSKEELEEASNNILRRTKEKAFWKGRPIIYGEGEKIFEEWPDGRIVDITGRPLSTEPLI